MLCNVQARGGINSRRQLAETFSHEFMVVPAKRVLRDIGFFILL